MQLNALISDKIAGTEIFFNVAISVRKPYWGVFPFGFTENYETLEIAAFFHELQKLPNLKASNKELFFIDAKLIDSIRSRAGVKINIDLGYQGFSGYRQLQKDDLSGSLVRLSNGIPCETPDDNLELVVQNLSRRLGYGEYTGIIERFLPKKLIIPSSIVDSIAVIYENEDRQIIYGDELSRRKHLQISEKSIDMDLDFSQIVLSQEPLVYCYNIENGNVYGQHPLELTQNGELIYRFKEGVLSVNPKFITFGIFEEQIRNAGGFPKYLTLTDGALGYCFFGVKEIKYMDVAQAQVSKAHFVTTTIDLRTGSELRLI